MTLEQKYLIELLSASIRKAKPKNPPTSVDWKILCEMAKKQLVFPLLYESVMMMDEIYRPDETILQYWKNETISCMMFFAVQHQKISAFLNDAENSGVEILLLKGMCIKDFYPVPELRTMSDYDMIIIDEQKDKVEQLFKSHGYEIKTKLGGEEVFCKNGCLPVEVFHTIPSGLKSKNGAVIDIRANTRPMFGVNVVKPSAENMLLHSVTHLIKHLRTRGAGIRNLADIILLVEKEELDRDYLTEQLKLLEVETIFYGLMRVAEKYLGLKPPPNCPEFDEKYIDLLMEYMVSNGVYGVMDNEYFLDARNAEGKRGLRVINYIRKMFPAPGKLSDKYSYAKKYPILLPVAWVHRTFFVIFKRGKSVGENIKSMNSATKSVNNQLEILEYFNIK